jgi:hypothetical protein
MKKLIPFVALLLLAVACNPFASFTTDTSTTEDITIVDFEATPSSITEGDSAKLIWNVTGATSIQIDQGIGTVAAAGTSSITPSATTTYTLSASNGDKSASQSFTVTVSSASSSTTTTTTTPTPPPLPPNIALFDISPNTIHVPPGPGPFKAIVRWDVKNAVSVTLDGNPVGATGSREVSPPLGTHTFILKATNPQGTVTKSQVLHVTP